MKKRILAMIFVLALCFCTVIPAFAVDADGFVSEYERVQDMAKLLSESEREALIKTLDELSERQKMDVIVVTTKTLDGKKPMEYADDIYDYCKYGYGEKYTFAMNGQTGKFVGNLPLDKSAATKWTVGLAAALSAAACGIAWLLHFAGIL